MAASSEHNGGIDPGTAVIAVASGKGGVGKSTVSDDVPLLASIPLYPAVAHAAERGRPVFVAQADGPQAPAFRELAEHVVAAIPAGFRA